MNKPEILFVSSFDWIGMYINGKLKIEGHQIKADDILYALGLEYKSIEIPMSKMEEGLPDEWPS